MHPSTLEKIIEREGGTRRERGRARSMRSCRARTIRAAPFGGSFVEVRGGELLECSERHALKKEEENEIHTDFRV